ncbi:splicing factor ESS-2 homolog [Agrilus planipennis]|uniref:Splicing factor ESS-2 homolog n=1 Tax=Agrilus planipennis TaxID=224129 RepID=A0A1W4X9M2_AGRPL|nr:splicing factor ESS-2 homolog [Agrilus planipennis]
MAKSPGISPEKQLASPIKSSQTEIVFKKPETLPKRRRKQTILDEETYIEKMGKIIQRDFFPDLEKLKAQNDYLDALEKNDMTRLREIHMKYSGRRPPTERIPSPATFETPANIHSSQNTETDPPVQDQQQENQDKESSDPKLSLDQFLNVHTSQDNESFKELMIEADKKHQEKYSYLYKEENKSNDEQRMLLALPSVEQQCELSEKKFIVDTWGYKNKNYIMFVPDGVELTDEEKIEMSKKKQEIVHSNTRLRENPFNEVQSKETINELAKSQAKVLDGKIGVDGKELIPPDTPKINGFKLVRSPSPYPGVAQSPLMTWGEIEGTPFRLDGSDTPIPKTPGPAFKIAEPAKREKIALALAEKVGEKHREDKRKAMDVARRQFATPSPKPNTPFSDRLALMSPAARRLATSRLKLGSSEFGSPLTSPSPLGRSITPRRVTPVSIRRAVTPKINLGKKRVDDNLTDDLLKINVPKRNRAADFF